MFNSESLVCVDGQSCVCLKKKGHTHSSSLSSVSIRPQHSLLLDQQPPSKHGLSLLLLAPAVSIYSEPLLVVKVSPRSH